MLDRLPLYALRCSLPLAALLFFEAACRAGLFPPALLPAPSAIALATLRAITDLHTWQSLAITIGRLLGGFGIALVVGVTAGLLASQSRLGSAILQTFIRVFSPVPKIALYPALILLLGFDHAPKVLLVAADCLFPILIASYQGACRVEPKLLWSARAMGTGRLRLLFRVVLPAAAPQLMTGVKIAATVGCVVVFIAEMVASSNGIGHDLALAVRTLRTVEMFVPLVFISAIGLLLNATLSAVQRRLHA